MQSLGKTCRNETKMTEAAAESGKIAKALKKYLITGVLVWLPIAVTIWAMTYIISAADRLISLLPESWQPQHFWGIQHTWFGHCCRHRRLVRYRRICRQRFRQTDSRRMG